MRIPRIRQSPGTVPGNPLLETTMPNQPGAPAPVGVAILWPRDLCVRYRITPETRRRWEKRGLLPPRDFFLNGQPAGWHAQTLDCADRGVKSA